MVDTDYRFWATIIGWFVLIFGGGSAWGILKHKTDAHQKIIDKCNVADIMTVTRCQDFHTTHQEATKVQLDNIETGIAEMKVDRHRLEQKLNDLVSKINVIYDRWERRKSESIINGG